MLKRLGIVKKAGMIAVSLLATFSVVYSMNKELSAEGGVISGAVKLNSATYASDSSIKRGQKIILGSYNGSQITWDVVKSGVTAGISNPPVKGAAVLMSADAVDSLKMATYKTYVENALNSYTNMNAALNNLENGLLLDKESDSKQGRLFMPSRDEYHAKWDFHVGNLMIQPHKDYTDTYCQSAHSCPELMNLWQDYPANTSPSALTYYYAGVIIPNNPFITIIGRDDAFISLRPWSLLNEDEFVFSLDANASKAVSSDKKVVSPDVNNAMKVRKLDNSIAVKMLNADKVVKVANDKKLPLKYANATVDNDLYVSVLISDSNGDMVQYQMIEKAKAEGNQSIAIDISALDMDKTYYAQFVNERVTSDDRPTTSSPLSEKVEFSKSIIPSLEDLAYQANHAITQSNLEDIYLSSSSGNVNIASEIGTLSTKKGVGNEIVNGVFENGITYNLIASTDTSHANDIAQFEIPRMDGSSQMLLNSSNKAFVQAKPTSGNYLPVGVYKYRIQAYDANGEPIGAAKNDGTAVSGIEPDQGLVLDDITTVVYPYGDQITFKQIKNDVSNTPDNIDDDEYYTTGTINESNPVIGNITFTSQANLQALVNEGYAIQSVKFYNTTTKAEITDIKATAIDTNTYNIMKNGTIASGDKQMDIVFTFAKAGKEVAKVRMSDQSLVIPGSLRFVNPEKLADDSAYLKPSEYVRTYDTKLTGASNTFTIKANDKDKATLSNEKIRYCVLLADRSGCDTTSNKDSIIQLQENIGSGTVSATVQAPNTADQEVYVRAWTYHVNASSQEIVQAKEDIKIMIKRPAQVLEWYGVDIQKNGNSIRKDTTKANPTWELDIQYEEVKTGEDNTNKNTYGGIQAYENKDKNTTKKVILRTNVYNTEGTPDLHISYTITPSNPVDVGKVTILPDVSDPNLFILNIQEELKDSITIVAKATATTNYNGTIDVDDASTQGNDITNATLILNVSTKPRIVFTPTIAYSGKGHVETGSNEAKGTTKFGDITLNPTQEDSYTYAIESVKQVNPQATGADDAYIVMSTDTFRIVNNKEVFTKVHSSGLSKGTYIIKLKGHQTSDASKEAAPIEVRIVVKDKELDIAKLHWQGADNLEADEVTPTYSNIGGVIKSVVVSEAGAEVERKQNRNTATYENVFEENDHFYVKVSNIVGGNELVGATITYAVAEGSSTGVIELQDEINGMFKMIGTNKEQDEVLIKATISKTGYENCIVYLPINLSKGSVDFAFAKADGTKYLIANVNKPNIYETQTLTYKSGDAALLNIFTQGAPSGTDVTIKISYNGTYEKNDVLKFAGSDAVKNSDTDKPKECIIKKEEYTAKRTSACQAMIENALYSQATDRGKVILSASIEATDNFDAKTIEMPIDIIPTENKDFDFVDGDLYIESNTDGSFSPVFQKKSSSHPDIGTGKISLLFSPSDEVDPDFTSDEVFYDENEFDDKDKQFLNGYKTFKYNITVNKDAQERTIHVYAQKEADRNYKMSEVKTLNVHIAPEGQSRFQVVVKSYLKEGDKALPSITYGDEYFVITASTSDDKEDDKATYSYSIDESAKLYLESYGSKENEFSPLKAGTKIKVNITRTSGTGTETKSSVYLSIKAKTIKLKVDDIKKKSGMSVVTNEYILTKESEAFLAKDIDKIKFVFWCKDANGVDITTYADGVRIVHNKLAISAKAEPVNSDDTVLTNYTIVGMDGKTSGIENGRLTVSEEESQKNWYELRPGKINETRDTKIGLNGWYNGPVDVFLMGGGTYDRIAPRDEKDAWESVKFTVSTEGSNTHTIYFRVSDGVDKGTVTKPQEEIIKIDTVSPKVTKIKAKLTHTDAFSQIINSITFGAFMKPGEEVTIETNDVEAYEGVEVSSTNSIKDGVLYSVYTLDGKGSRETQIITDGTLTTNDNGISSFTLKEPGVYEVCAIVQDQAGNLSDEKCEKLLVKKVNFDGDGDDTLDYLDPDEDGCPDIDIVLTDEKGKLYKINVDRDEDGIPDLNIDSDGDGIAEINVDTDTDGKPDLNLVVLTKWEPTFCVTDQSDEYCTMKDIKPVINVDTGKDGIPDIDIDNIGDFKPHLNISKDGKVASTNIVKLHNWKPLSDYSKDTFLYDSLGTEIKPLANIDTDNDGRADINLDFNNDGIPDLNIDGDGDGIPELNIDGNGDGIADYNLDPDENGKPTKNIITISSWDPKIDFEKDGSLFDTMEFKAKAELEDNEVKVEKPGGSFLPNFSIKVSDISDSVEEKVKEAIEKLAKDQEIKIVYDVNLWENDIITQPDGTLRVKLPYDETIKNPKVIIEMEDGSFKEVKAVIEDGYLVYESDYLGKVSVIGDKEESEPEPEPKPDIPMPDLKPSGSGGSTPDTSVKGNYTTGVGGASTGDTNQPILYISCIFISTGLLLILRYKRKRM